MIEHSPLHRAPVGGEYYVFRDPVHNLIEIDNDAEGRLIRRLLRTREMQRLRHIAQNGLGNYVYQGLEGTRFPHSLGTYHVARLLIRSLKDRQPMGSDFPDSMRIAAADVVAFPVAALIHDLGHGPLSHVWEQCLCNPTFEEIRHEEWSTALLTSSTSELGEYLRSGVTQDFPEFASLYDDVLALLKKEHRLYYLHPLLSGNMDVDRLDFIARDTRNGGVTYGFHDLTWITRSFRFARLAPALVAQKHEHFDPFWTIAVDGRKGTNTLVQFLHARENMYSLVYLHKTVRGAAVLFHNIMERAAHTVRANAQVPVRSDALRKVLLRERPTPEEYLSLDDNTVWEQVKEWAYGANPDQVLRTLCAKLYNRSYFKVFSISETTFKAMKQLEEGESSLFASIFAAKTGMTVDEARSFYGFDVAAFNKVGREHDRPQANVWIMEEGIEGHQFTSLHDFWEQRQETLEVTTHHFAVDERMLTEANLIVERLSHAASPTAETIEGPTQYRVVASLGKEGAWKSAYIGINRTPGDDKDTVVALKSYKTAGDETALDRDVRKVNMLLDGVDGAAYLAQARMAGKTADRTWLVETLWSASLLDLVHQSGPMADAYELARVGSHLASGLAALHSAGLRHTDVKLDNCGVMRVQGTVDRYVLGDFGCVSPRINERPEDPRLRGTMRTRAPEVFLNDEFSLAADVWALGATIYAVATGRYPFTPLDSAHVEGADRQAEEERIKAALPKVLLPAFLKDLTESLPPAIFTLIEGCFRDRKKRVTAAELKEGFKQFLTRLDTQDTRSQAKVRGYWQRAESMCVQQSLTGVQSDPDDLAEVTGAGSSFIPPRLLASLKRLP